MILRLRRLFLLSTAFAFVGAHTARAQFSVSGGNANAPRIGFAIKGSPEVDAKGQMRFADYPVVTTVDSGSSAQKAGITSGDVILEVNGKDAREGRLFRERATGTKYSVRVRRGQETRQIEFVFTPMASAAKSPADSVVRKP